LGHARDIEAALALLHEHAATHALAATEPEPELALGLGLGLADGHDRALAST